MSKSEADLRQYFLDQAVSLGELSETALAYIMQDAAIDDKWEVPLKKRLQWVDGHKWTLEDSAGLIGVTRERMRQIQIQLEETPFRTIVPPRVLYKVLALRQGVGSIEEFWKTLRSEGLAGPEEDWSKESLTALFLKLGNHSVVEDLGRMFRELSPPPPSRKNNALIRQSRIKLFGIVDLERASESSGLEVEDVVHVLRGLYTHVFENGQVALAIQRPPAAFVDTVAKQLLINPKVQIAELYEGVRRQMSYRGVIQDFSFPQFVQLAGMIFGNPPSVDNIPEELRYETDFSEHEKAFLQAFRQSGRRTMHRNELIEVAANRGLNPTSAGVYLSTSPIVRPSSVKRGYFRTV